MNNLFPPERHTNHTVDISISVRASKGAPPTYIRISTREEPSFLKKIASLVKIIWGKLAQGDKDGE